LPLIGRLLRRPELYTHLPEPFVVNRVHLRPIDEAPKDGSPIVGWDEDSFRIVFYREEDWRDKRECPAGWVDVRGGRKLYPTHYAPIGGFEDE